MSDGIVGAMDVPNEDGYWAFEGRLDGSSVEKLQRCVMVRRNSIDNNLYAFWFGGREFKVSQMIGKWWKLTMPWDATPSPVGASVLWSDERITNEAHEFAKKEGAHSTDAVEMIARRMRNDYEAHRGASVPSEVMETIKESVNYAKKSVNELGKRSLTQREIDFAIARFDAALTWLAQQRGQGGKYE